MNLFLTGTDTGVGKTYVAARLIRALRKQGIDCVGFKPICCGGREDAEELHAASAGVLSLNDVNPVWMRTPAAPYTATLVESRSIDLALIRATYRRLRAQHRSVIVEGVGGWFVPIERDFSVSDLAAEMELPVAVVVANRLGALNHTLLTIRAIRASGVVCAGIILNQIHAPSDEDSVACATNRAVLKELAAVPILFDLAADQPEIELALC